MPRRKTRKVTKKQPRKPTRTRTRSGATAKVLKSSVALIAATCVKIIRTLTPSGETVNRVAAGAWHSRSVRRCAGLVGGIVVVGLLSWVMLHNLRDTDRYTVDPGRIELSANPAWAKGTLAKQLKVDIEDALRADLADMPKSSAFDAEIMQTISDRLENDPWVARVIRIERRFPTDADSSSFLLPVLEIRTPAIAVERDDHYVLVDGDYVVLPLSLKRDEFEHFESQLNVRLRIVRGVEGEAPVAGKPWTTEQVAAAISMERVIRKAQLDNAIHIEAIELIGVPQQADARGRVHYQPDGGVVLIPDQASLPGTRLIWGRPPVHASTLELSPNDKLEQLRAKLLALDSVAETRIDLRYKG
ncbi:MAG: hypothetical protein R3E76_00290 [Planctomycetota bacterium]